MDIVLDSLDADFVLDSLDVDLVVDSLDTLVYSAPMASRDLDWLALFASAATEYGDEERIVAPGSAAHLRSQGERLLP